MGAASKGRGKGLHIEKVAALELNALTATTLAARRLLVRWLGKPKECRAAIEVLDAQEGLVIERRKSEGEAADHRAIGLLQRRAGRHFSGSARWSRNPCGFVRNDDKTASLESGRQKSFVDKIKDAEWFDASVLRGFGF